MCLKCCNLMFMLESPYYLVMKDKNKEAEKSLQLFRQNRDVSSELSRVSEVVKEDQAQSGHFYELFTVPSNRRAAIIVFGLRTFQQFSGTTVITFYAQSIFREASGDISASTASMIYFTLQLICAMTSSFLVDKVGRKPLLVISIIGSGVALSLEGTYFFLSNNTTVDVSNLKIIPLVALLGYVVIFNIGMGVIPVLFLGEMFSTNVKALALCLADIWFGILVTAASKFFQVMQDGFGISVPFFTFAICCALGLVFIFFVVPETKGKTLEDIQEELKGKKEKEITEKNPV
ncbi:facilitated trehalose transporter Tret1-like [Sitophilus oryzae]|uniref:Facilitated trehalose transporter Tret1-like n=1 Tax=Sitophilus oryzae TaxID=7048 RepID=A0A6J2YTR1_SITOR|nr:facilitated trehalose transporter Tret1-like [Sitophilus oryzae]